MRLGQIWSQAVCRDLLLVEGSLSARAEMLHLTGHQAWEEKVVGNMLNRNKEEKLWLWQHPSNPTEIFLQHSQGYNRGPLTMSLELLNGSVYLYPVEKWQE